jgi:soluble P-type ATPase
MIEISIPRFGELRLEHLVSDYNGTLACDGKLVEGVADELRQLANDLRLHVITADTFGKARSALEGLPVELTIVPMGTEEVAKRDYLLRIDPDATVAIGNGRNDRLMLRHARLGIAVIQEEGAASETLSMADVVCSGILPALRLFRNPRRLIATLRS